MDKTELRARGLSETDAEREARRRAILQAAIETFAQQGFAAARTRDIAAHAGVAEGTIDLYFDSKDELLLTAFRETVKEFSASVERLLESAGAPDHTLIWAMLETPIAMLHAEEICSSSERLAVLVMGTNDLAKELQAEHVPGRQPVITGLGLALLAARAAGIVIIDGVYNDVKNAEGFAAEVEQGRQMGFDGKTLIHPGQVEPANSGFAPSEKAIEDAKGLLPLLNLGDAMSALPSEGTR